MLKKNLLKDLLLGASVVVGTSFFCVEYAYSQNYANQERAEAAKAHYRRARILLTEAMKEFDQGRSIAKPDLIINSEEWRARVGESTNDLNKVIDPRPRIERGGVRMSDNIKITQPGKKKPEVKKEEVRKSSVQVIEDIGDELEDLLKDATELESKPKASSVVTEQEDKKEESSKPEEVKAKKDDWGLEKGDETKIVLDEVGIDVSKEDVATAKEEEENREIVADDEEIEDDLNRYLREVDESDPLENDVSTDPELPSVEDFK